MVTVPDWLKFGKEDKVERTNFAKRLKKSGFETEDELMDLADIVHNRVKDLAKQLKGAEQKEAKEIQTDADLLRRGLKSHFNHGD